MVPFILFFSSFISYGYSVGLHDLGLRASGDFNYTDVSKWKEDYPTCGLNRQSPIDIVSGSAKEKGFNYIQFENYELPIKSYTIKNTGKTMVITLAPEKGKAPCISGGGLTNQYELAQMHFHWGPNDAEGSEHTLDGKKFPLEIHLVHFQKAIGGLTADALANPNGLAVIGWFYEVDAKENAAYKPFIDSFKDIVEKDATKTITTELKLPNLFGALEKQSFYRYYGSLTTPTCNEAVVWTVMKNKLKLSKEQIAEFRKLKKDATSTISKNYRTPQKLAGREVWKNSETMGMCTM